ncbi:MAG: hypothetical protein M1829_000516 [Trizodia sp. TS-e1964]|nr:MAG: hypothetical protein M1829_000516 [Trizodia sp. TS-e1964]
MDAADSKAAATGPRIRYAVDEEAMLNEHPKLSRTLSTGSQMSIRSYHSASGRRASIDPATAIPIEYRTISYQIEEPKEAERARADAKRAKETAELADLEWHTLSPQELLTRLSTSLVQGLSVEQVTRRQAEYGRNVPSPPPSRLLQKVLGYLFGGFGAILLIASILVFISWKPLGEPPAPANLALAVVLLIVFVVQAVFNAWQDWSSSRVMASITTMLPDNCLLLRDGVQVRALAFDIVPGDVLFIKAGNKLPADVRFLEISSDAKFDRSILTGESLPVSGTVDSTDDNYLETHCIGMQGTHCISGSGMGVCVATGDRTVFGRIAQLTSRPTTSLTTLQKEILRFVIVICSLVVLVIILVIILWATWIRKSHPLWITTPGLIVDCVSIAVAFIPEGLPIALTASLTITANLMRQNKILCKSLKTVETLGAVSVICSDKTGTLTKNQMFVTECAIGSDKMTPEEAREELVQKRELQDPSRPVNLAVEQLRAIAGLCNAGEFDAATSHLPLVERKINGDATDQAILRFSEGLGPGAELKKSWRKVFDLAFNSKNKFMIRVLSLVNSAGLDIALPSEEASNFNTDDLLLTIKGAPDVLIDRCNTYITKEGTTQPLTAPARAAFETIKDEWSSHGKRVILLARKVLPQSEIRSSPDSSNFERETMDHAKSELTLVGLVGIVDPPREEIPEVVRILRGAGIRIFMVTGDFKLTALAIAQECGIITNPPAQVHDISALLRDKMSEKVLFSDIEHSDEAGARSIVLSGPELIALNDNQWAQLCSYDEIVFARTTPEQKLRIVRELQSTGALVGMTGDGVNDAPSLKAANIGIALGSGSDIAIEASDMVLLDSFSAIVEAVQYGRVVYDNLKKTICYMLPAGTFAEFWPITTNVLFGLPQILSSFLMIVICCFTDCAAATTLSYEKPESDVLRRPPRNPRKDRLVDWRLIFHAYLFIGVFEALPSFAMSYWYAQRNGVPFSVLALRYGELPPEYDPEHVAQVLNEASSVYFVNLVIMQWFNLMATRTRRLSIFQHPPLFNKHTQNIYLFPAIAFSLAVIFFFCYVPPLQNLLLSTTVPVEHFFLPMAFGLGILGADEARKWVVRTWPRGWVARAAW